MAHKLESYVFGGRFSTKPKYDYDLYFDGSVWQLEPGVDFEGNPASVSQTFYSAARKRGFRCRCRVQPDGTLVLQAYNFPQEGETASSESSASAGDAGPASSAIAS